MERYYTCKLFYKRFPYRILINRSINRKKPDYQTGYTVESATEFLKTHNIDHRMYNRVSGKSRITINSSIFLKTRNDFDVCLDKWRENVKSITAPYKEEHVQLLSGNTEIVIREKLLYNRFRYAVTFKASMYDDERTEFENWLKSTFQQDSSNQSSTKYMLGWQPRLYLNNDADLVLTKLTYSEHISNITIVYTLDELSSN
jgi:hypothetical protein